jgi:site-specific DNA-adenine methylase
MRPHTQTKNVKLFCADALDVLRSLDDSSVDLITTDPPYFKVKDEDWDHQWSTTTDFLAWLDDVLTECKRVLKSYGSERAIELGHTADVFLSCLCGSELGGIAGGVFGIFLSCLCGSEQ